MKFSFCAKVPTHKVSLSRSVRWMVRNEQHKKKDFKFDSKKKIYIYIDAIHPPKGDKRRCSYFRILSQKISWKQRSCSHVYDQPLTILAPVAFAPVIISKLLKFLNIRCFMAEGVPHQLRILPQKEMPKWQLQRVVTSSAIT